MNVRTIIKKFNVEYGKEVGFRSLNPLDELMLTILSQNTSDLNSLRAFKNLVLLGSWEDIMRMDVRKIRSAIKEGGLADIKSKRIKNTLKEIQKRNGELSLENLGAMSLEEARKWLTSIKGVGPKTAAIVLLFSFQKPDMPVDTHVFRVSKRLGLVPKNLDRVKAQKVLNALVPDEEKLSFHINLIMHGRKVCKAPTPLCEQCFMKKSCPKVGVK